MKAATRPLTSAAEAIAKPVQRHAAGSAASRLAKIAPAAPSAAGRLTALAPRPAALAGVPKGLAASVERLSGVSLSGVRVHHGSAAPGRIGARAFARGDDVHIGPGQAASLPHELWHVTQQRAGRVSPETRLADGTPLNDAPKLEQEARQMGARAWAERHAKAAPLVQRAPLSKAADVVQPEWFTDGNTWRWVEPGDAAPQGFFQQRPPNTSYFPRMNHPYGKGDTSIGTQGQVTRTHGPLSAALMAPNLDALNRNAKEAGKDLALRSANLDPQGFQDQIARLVALAEELEDTAGVSLPANHAQKIADLYDKPSFSGTKYRTVTKAQDEMFRSSTAGHFFLAYRKKVENNPNIGANQKDHLHDLGAAFLRVASAARTPTKAVVAPTLSATGQVIGQQHPTSSDIPILAGGRSGHGLNDPLRASKALDTYNTLKADQNAPPHAVFNTMMLAAVTGTLNHMMWPSAAKNVASWNPPAHPEQMKEREAVKHMGNLLAHTVHVESSQGLQAYDDPTMATEAPTSPRRQMPH